MIIEMIKGGLKVGFFGLGMSNGSLLSILPLEKCEITLRSDTNIALEDIPSGIIPKRIFCGKDCCKEINEDIIFFSPSVRRDRPELISAEAKGVIFSSDAELFFEENEKKILLVSGSDGKSTTAALIHLLLSKSGYKSRLIGNIGEPLTEHLSCDADYFVIELSSFMLSYLKPTSEAACITNITQNHLDWHRDFEEYKKVKLSVFDNTRRAIISDGYEYNGRAFAVISGDSDFYELSKKRNVDLYFTIEKGYICKNGNKIINIDEINRKEKHNLKNLMMAMAMTEGLVKISDVISVAKDFSGLSHRCERVLSEGGIEYIDSSIDSTPARTAQTL